MGSQNVKREAPSPSNGNPEKPKGVALKILSYWIILMGIT